ncbi:hypothetical protein VNO77_14387 [Canavalia gladiata]|uniref:Uncharacterized protein n=1 Tax=Canavalia gladiata TaxID=3824 RepID=A0AAN9QVE9_CANGL
MFGGKRKYKFWRIRKGCDKEEKQQFVNNLSKGEKERSEKWLKLAISIFSRRKELTNFSDKGGLRGVSEEGTSSTASSNSRVVSDVQASDFHGVSNSGGKLSMQEVKWQSGDDGSRVCQLRVGGL